MNWTLSLLLVFLNQFFMPRHNAQLRLLKAQITILQARIPTKRIILSPAEKAELLRIGEECERWSCFFDQIAAKLRWIRVSYQAAILMGLVRFAWTSSGVKMPWVEWGRTAL